MVPPKHPPIFSEKKSFFVCARFAAKKHIKTDTLLFFAKKYNGVQHRNSSFIKDGGWVT